MAPPSNASPSVAASQVRRISPTPVCSDEVDLTPGSECLSVFGPSWAGLGALAGLSSSENYRVAGGVDSLDW